MDLPDPTTQPPADAGKEEPDLPPLGAGLDLTDPNSPLAPYYLRASHVVAVALLALIFVFCNLLPVWHTDIWGHLQFGRWMVEHGRLPEHEPFADFADHQAVYVNFQWLTQAGFYLLYRFGELLAGGDWVRQFEGGAEMLRAGQVVLVVLRFAVLLVAYRRLTGSLPLACAGTAVLLVIGLGHLAVVRPQVAGELFFACLLLALSRPVLSARSLVLVPLLMVVWANAHGSFGVGLFLLAVSLAGRIVEAWQAATGNPFRSVLRDAQAHRLLAVLLLSAGAIALLNPHGPYLYLHTLTLARNPNIATLEEWQPLDFTWGPGGHWGYLATLVLLTVSQFLSPRRLAPTELLLLLTFGVFPCFQQRMMLWWEMLVPWLVLPLWAAIGARSSWRWLRFQSVPSFRKTLLAALVVGLALLWSAPAQWLIRGHPQPLDLCVSRGTPWKVAAELVAPAEDQPQWLPDLGQELRQRYPAGRFTGRVFASETQGDYLSWALSPDFPVLVFTHAQLFPPRHWQDCLTVKSGSPGWWEVLDRDRVNLVVVEAETHARLTALLRKDPGWQVVVDEAGDRAKRDPRTRLFVALRKKPL
jgi:hypothetical protein